MTHTQTAPFLYLSIRGDPAAGAARCLDRGAVDLFRLSGRGHSGLVPFELERGEPR